MPRFTDLRVEDTQTCTSYNDEEVEFMMAIERYKRIAQRPFPTWHEVLQVVQALGYRKVAPPAKRPQRPASE